MKLTFKKLTYDPKAFRGYKVELDGAHIGDVYVNPDKTWDAYLPQAHNPINRKFTYPTRRKAALALTSQ